MFKIKLLTVSVIAVATIATANAAEVIYKWKDSKGNIKYTQSMPPSGIDYTTIRNRTSKKTEAQKTQTEASTPKASAEDKMLAAQNAEQQRVNALNAERAAKNCTIAKNNLATLESSPRIRIEENGEQRMLTAEEIADRLKKAKENIGKYCK